jgi:hypothetical protein
METTTWNGASLEEARELAELTAINADGNDLEETLKQTGSIVSNLETINEDGNDLEELLKQTCVFGKPALSRIRGLFAGGFAATTSG